MLCPVKGCPTTRRFPTGHGSIRNTQVLHLSFVQYVEPSNSSHHQVQDEESHVKVELEISIWTL